MDGAGAQLFDIEAERRRCLVPRRRRATGGAALLLFTGVRIVRLPSLAVARGQVIAAPA